MHPHKKFANNRGCITQTERRGVNHHDETAMISISKYELEYDKKFMSYRVVTSEKIGCPVCVSELTKKGLRKRGLIWIKEGATEDDIDPYETVTIMLQRYKCKQCGKIHHELPDCIVPYKRHSLAIIEQTISSPEKQLLLDEQVVHRITAWWELMVQYIIRVAGAIKSKYSIVITPDQDLAVIVRALANSHLFPGTRYAMRAPG